MEKTKLFQAPIEPEAPLVSKRRADIIIYIEKAVCFGRSLNSLGRAKLIAKEGKLATLKFPSGEVRLISKNCSATVGQVGNIGRPVVRGVVMNPVDHPHGGGEGRATIGRKKPATPWGYPTLGRRSRKKITYSNNLILCHRCK
ncbi:hypothetical protein HN873_004676 [Arachis hypogaea]